MSALGILGREGVCNLHTVQSLLLQLQGKLRQRFALSLAKCSKEDWVALGMNT